MGKRLAIAAAIVALLIGGAYVVYSRLWRERSAPAPGPVAAARAPATVDAAVPLNSERRRIALTAAEGRVERQAAGHDWQPAKVGDELSLDESLRTGEGARAQLDLGAATSVEVAGGTQFSVSEVSSRLSRVKLTDGRVSATVQGSGARLRVEVGGSDATAEAEKGTFSVLTDGKGQVAVAATAGRVALSAKSKTVDVAAGEQAVVKPEMPPSAPEKIPPSLFVKVGAPKSLVLRRREISIRGSASSGAVVVVNGVRTTVDDKGEFAAMVPLREGSNRVVVAASDALGRRQEAALPAITVDTRPPDTKTKVTW
jgi:hypothetical protein